MIGHLSYAHRPTRFDTVKGVSNADWRRDYLEPSSIGINRIAVLAALPGCGMPERLLIISRLTVCHQVKTPFSVHSPMSCPLQLQLYSLSSTNRGE